jgi:hypothetical protein
MPGWSLNLGTQPSHLGFQVPIFLSPMGFADPVTARRFRALRSRNCFSRNPSSAGGAVRDGRMSVHLRVSISP